MERTVRTVLEKAAVKFWLEVPSMFFDGKPEPLQPKERDLTSFKTAEDMVFTFEAILLKHGIKVADGSDLNRICLKVLELQHFHSIGHDSATTEDIRPFVSEVVGLISMIRKIIRLSGHPDFRQLIPHLNLLNTGMPSQNVRTPVSDQAANKIFELLIALLCMDIGSQLALDPPNHSKGTNPDVIATIGSEKWGFACKVLSGFAAMTMFERLQEGINQIEASPAQRGCVVFNMKNVLNHDKLWPILNPEEVKMGKEPVYGSWRHFEHVVAELSAVAGYRHKELESHVTLEELRKVFENKKAIPGCLLFLQTGTAITTSHGPLPTSIGTFVFLDLLHSGANYPVLQKLNEAMHDH